MITQAELKHKYTYHPKAGLFTRNLSAGRWKKGTIAGHTNKIHGRVELRINKKLYKAHRLAWLYMTGEWPKHEIDHIDGNNQNNRWANLRDVPHIENGRNQKTPTNNTTGICGVVKHSNGFVAQIKIEYKKQYLGYFKDFFEACCARRSAENKYGFHENHGRR